MQATDQRVALFEEIFYATRNRLFGFAKKILQDDSKVQDCMQHCYMKLWESMGRIDTQKEMMPLLYNYVKNYCVDQVRKNSRYVSLADPSIFAEKWDVENEAEAGIRQQDADHQLAGIFNDMPPRRRQVFTLIKLNGLSYREVSEHLNISISTVEKHMHEASKSLTPESMIKIMVLVYVTAMP